MQASSDIVPASESPFPSYDSIYSVLSSGYKPLETAPTDADVLSRMSEFSRSVYLSVRTLQDHRNDQGHANTVIHFTQELSRLLEFNDLQTETAVLAAICHDIGWSQIKDVNAIFNNLVTRYQSVRNQGDSPQLLEDLLTEERALRIQHQQASVKIAAPLVANHPYHDLICQTVGDHDTRQHTFSRTFLPFLDADWLWRVTATAVGSGSAGNWDKSDPNKVAEFISQPALTLPFLLPLSRRLARLEATSAMLTLQKNNAWKDLPTTFSTEFAEEIAILSGLQTVRLPKIPAVRDQWSSVICAPITEGTLARSGGIAPPLSPPSLSPDYQNKLRELFPNNMPTQFLNAWHQALENSAMPVDFAAAHSYHTFTFTIDDHTFSGIKVSGINHEMRRNIIKNTTQHVPGQELESYGCNFSSDCALDPNIAQSLDAALKVSGVKTNSLADFGDYLLMVNKFPWFVGDTLLLPKRHDDQEHRALFSPETRRWTKRIPSDTRGAIISPDFLATVIAVCDRFGQAAQRNHALDGMSVPLHDHFKLMPANHPALSLIPEFIRVVELHGSQVLAYRADHTPFDTLCITSLDHGQLARTSAELLELLERADQIFTIVYAERTLLITPRNADLYGDGNPDGWTGSGVGYHAIEDPAEGTPHFARVQKYIARQGTFDWQRFLAKCQIDLHPSLDR